MYIIQVYDEEPAPEPRKLNDEWARKLNAKQTASSGNETHA